MMEDLVIILVRGIGSGAVFALLAMSLNLIYNATGVLNFAQGQLLVVAGVLTYLWAPGGQGPASLGWWFTLLAVVVAVSLIAAVQGVITLIPLRSGHDHHSWIITTIAASIIMGALVVLSIGPRTVHVPNHFGSFSLVGANIPTVYAVLLVLAVAVHQLMRWYQRKSLSGLALSALSQDLDAARAAGVPTLRLQVFAFALAGAITAATAFLGGHVIEVSESQALHYVIFGFIVAVIGGIGNQTGSVLSGPVFGVVLMFAAFEAGGGVQVPTALALIVLVLMIKPQGIFGRPQARRV